MAQLEAYLQRALEREPRGQRGGDFLDFSIFDYISVNTYWTTPFIAHALFAVALLGALTHQGASPTRWRRLSDTSAIRRTATRW